MERNYWAFVGGLFLTTLLLVIGLWANYQLSGDAFALARGGGSLVESTSLLFTSLFVGLSGGHYIGGSFKNGKGKRMFALGANTVLWGVLVGFVLLQINQGENFVAPMMYSAFLILSGGGIFALHRAKLIHDQSRLDKLVNQFSSKGTSIVVVATMIIRTAPEPFITAAIVVGAVVIAVAIWNAYGSYITDRLEDFEMKIDKLRTLDDGHYELRERD